MPYCNPDVQVCAYQWRGICHYCGEFLLGLRYFSIPAVNRDWQSDNMGKGTNKRKVLSVQEQFNEIRATENGKRES
jgi:hypothetical protein